MPLDVAAVGAVYETPPRRIDRGATLAFAAGLGAVEPAFLDDAALPPTAGLPFQCVSLEWPAVLGLRALTSHGLTEPEARRAVHAGQSSRFLQAIPAGRLVQTQARLAALRPSRAGAVCTYLIETCCAETRRTLVTTRSTTIFRGVPVTGGSHNLAELPPSAPGRAIGPRSLEIEIPTGRGAAHIYSACADIWNPIHTERRVALAAGLPDIILHGTATWALAGVAVIREHCALRPSRLRALSGDFTGLVIPGDTLRLRLGEPDHAGRIGFDVCGPSGATVLRDGEAIIDAE